MRGGKTPDLKGEVCRRKTNSVLTCLMYAQVNLDYKARE
jgi:hypothetical protein